MRDIISKENLNILEELGLKDLFKNSLEKRIVVIGDSDYKGEDLSEFINKSEYVVRTDYGKSIPEKRLGHKTDIIYIDRFNFTPFDSKNMISDFNNFFYKKAFDDSREVWFPIHKYLVNEFFFKTVKNQVEINGQMIEDSLSNEGSRDVLFDHIKHLYMHKKNNIKMLDSSEYDSMCSHLAEGFIVPSPLFYCIYMCLSDDRFKDYPKYYVNIENSRYIDFKVSRFEYHVDTSEEIDFLEKLDSSYNVHPL